jgi:hypothetical protein
MGQFDDSANGWPMYGQWNSWSQTTDNSPNAVQQHDTHNCGVFTCTNALCLAFGYDLLCYEEKDLNQLKGGE